MIKKILLTTALITVSSTAFASKSSKLQVSARFLQTVEHAFKKPVFTDLNERNVKSRAFDYNTYKKQKTDFQKKNFLSNYLKLKDIGLVNNKSEVLMVKSRNSLKMNHPVFKEVIPENTREQMITVIKVIPKKLRNYCDTASSRSFKTKPTQSTKLTPHHHLRHCRKSFK